MAEAMHELLERAMRLHREGQLAVAASLYREILCLQPRDFDATNLLGSICLRQGAFGEAVAVLGEALEINPKSVEAWLNFGYALSHLDRLDEALASFRRVIELRPGFAEAHSALAMVSAALDRHDEAAASWRRATEIEPASAELHNNLGAALSELGRHEEAALSYRRAIELRPGSAELHNNLGLALVGLDRSEEAAASYRRAIEIAPDYGPAHNNLGVVLSRLGRIEEAAASYRCAIAITPGDAEAHNNLGAALSKLDRHQEAAEGYRRAIEIEPDHAEAHNNLGNALARLDRVDDAFACYRHAIEIEPDYAEAYANLGTLEVRSRRYDAAVVSFRRALAISPEIAEAHNGLAHALAQARQPAEAIAHYEKALGIKPDYAEAHNNLGIALRMLGRIEEGRRAIETAIRLAPDRVEFYASLAASSKRFTEADPHLAAMEELARNLASLSNEDRLQLHFALGKALADAGKHRQAFDHLLAGNALKRRQTAYDEAAALAAFDRIRTVFSAEIMRDKAGFGHPSAVPVFIIGMPRSGTTLVEQILASHSRVFGAGEIGDFTDAVAQLGATDQAAASFRDGIPDVSGLQLHQLGANYVERLRARAPAALRITDKLPANFSLAGLIHLALPNARIIHTRRDPVDTCLSCFSILFGGHQPQTYDLRELGRYYRAYAALMEHWRRVLPPGVMLEVQYEELVADLEHQARRLVAHCGLDWEDACLEFHKTQRPVWTASVNQVRQPIYRTAVGRWRPYKDMLGPLLAELGVTSEPE
jgi:tetratricopeptide (TPR) repeat protein